MNLFSLVFDVFSKSPDAAIKIKNIPCSISKDKGSASSNNRIKSIFDFDESGGEEEDDAGSDSEVILLHKKNKSAATQPPPVSSTRKRKVIHSSSDED